MPIFCKIKSKIKMVVLTGPGCKNIVWYSILNKDKYPEKKIINAMLNRLKAQDDLYNKVNVIQFYCNQTKRLIEEYKK